MLHCVSQKHNGLNNNSINNKLKAFAPMLLNDILNRVLIIDDKEEETIGLREVLERDDISVDYHTPDIPRNYQFRRNRQLIFMDLMLDGNINNLKTNISKIISILRNNLSKDFGLYGLVVWTSHHDEAESLKEALGRAYKKDLQNAQKKDEISTATDIETVSFKTSPIVPPLFVVSLDKTDYIRNGYENLLSDLSELIKEDTAAYFFTSWYGSVVKGVGKSIHDIYSLAPEYPKRKDELKYLLYSLGLNHIGISKKNAKGYDKTTEDTFKAFDELLMADLNTDDRSAQPLYNEEPQKPWSNDLIKKMKISSMLNAKLFIDTEDLSDKHIVPGNVYKVLKDDNPLVISAKPQDFSKYNLSYENVAIELTPPCDFSNKKAGSRLIGGFAFELKEGITKRDLVGMKASLVGDRYYKLCMVMVGEKIMVYCFDFRYLFTPSEAELKDQSQYELLFRAKPKLFADILQKFSSHAARLGLSNIDLS